jgi:carboxylesterase type B
LYLDLQVPEKAIRNPSLRLPVVVYLYGGAFVLGDKDVLQPLLPFYDGSGMIKQSGGDIIFISFNYRVGALGFLAGSTMEREGLANAGLWDQRAVFQWVQSHISKVGGDPEQVTAMGESSGASSILFHLVANGGTLDPLFRRAILMSPAYQPMWDRSGLVEDKFQQFATLAGCGGKGVSCLRKVNSNKLKEANRQLMKQQRPGTFAVGPTPDGSFIRQLPTVELQAGKVWPIDSVVLSYCAHESLLFASRSVRSDAGFEEFIHDIFPNYTVSSGLTGKVLDFYPPVGTGGGQFYSQPKRLEAFLRDSCFTCNVRYLAEALGSSKVWVMKYGVAPGWHGTDLVPAFFNEDFNMDSLMEFLASLVHIVAGLFLRGLSRAYQSYFASYASTGDPNQERLSLWNNLPYPGTVEWKRPSFAGENVGGVLKVDYGLFNFFQMVDDDQMPRAACEFWKDFARAVTLDGGYTPASRP